MPACPNIRFNRSSGPRGLSNQCRLAAARRTASLYRNETLFMTRFAIRTVHMAACGWLACGNRLRERHVGQCRRLTAVMLLIAWISGIGSAPVEAAERPNIVFILADDLGWGELGCYGQTKIRTPHIDRLASQGMRFTNAYSGAPVCAPSRCTLMTGLHLGHAQVRGNKQATGADGKPGEGQHPLTRQPVNVRRPNLRLPITAEFPPAEIIGEDEHNVRSFGSPRWGKVPAKAPHDQDNGRETVLRDGL